MTGEVLLFDVECGMWLAVLSNKEEKSKKGIVSNHLFADLVILDPTLTYSTPKDLVLTTGLDAFCQCVEGFTSKNHSPVVDIIALKGIEVISRNLVDSINGVENARDEVYFGAYLSGIAITAGNAGTNIVHAIGNTIGGIYGSPHGVSVAAVLEQGLRFNAVEPKFRDRLTEIGRLINVDVIKFINEIRTKIGIPTLKDLGVLEKDIPNIAKKVISDQQRLLTNNQREVSFEDVQNILRASL